MRQPPFLKLVDRHCSLPCFILPSCCAKKNLNQGTSFVQFAVQFLDFGDHSRPSRAQVVQCHVHPSERHHLAPRKGGPTWQLSWGGWTACTMRFGNPEKDRKGLQTWNMCTTHHLYHPGFLFFLGGAIPYIIYIYSSFGRAPLQIVRCRWLNLAISLCLMEKTKDIDISGFINHLNSKWWSCPSFFQKPKQSHSPSSPKAPSLAISKSALVMHVWMDGPSSFKISFTAS